MNVRARLSILLCILSLVAGCRHIDDAGVLVAAMEKYSYEWRDGNFGIWSTAIVAVAVLDRRSYVLSGEKPPNFTGIFHNDVYLPFYAVTLSGYPLARDFGESIAQALRTGGTESFRVDIRPTQDNEVAKKRLLSEDADRFVLVKLWEWSTDTYGHVELYYYVELEIYDRSGKVLASKELQGTDLTKNIFYGKDRKKFVSDLYAKKLEELFFDPLVVDSLTLSD